MAQDFSLEDVPQLIKSGKIPVALRILSEHNHPIIHRLFPEWSTESEAVSSTETDSLLIEEQFQRLKSYVFQERFTNTVTALFLLLVGGVAVTMGTIGLVQLLTGGLAALRSNGLIITFCCGGPLGLPILLLGLTAFRDSRSGNYGLW